MTNDRTKGKVIQADVLVRARGEKRRRVPTTIGGANPGVKSRGKDTLKTSRAHRSGAHAGRRPTDTGRIFTSKELEQLQGFRIHNVSLEALDFANADLDNAHFERVSLRGCDFTYASLRNAAFIDCDLRGAWFRGADLDGCNFSGSWLIGDAGMTAVQRLCVRERGGHFVGVLCSSR